MFDYDKFHAQLSFVHDNFMKCSEFTVPFTFSILVNITTLVDVASNKKKTGEKWDVDYIYYVVSS